MQVQPQLGPRRLRPHVQPGVGGFRHALRGAFLLPPPSHLTDPSCSRPEGKGRAQSENDAKLAQKLGQL